MSPTKARISQALLIASPWLALGACTSPAPSHRQCQTIYLDSPPRHRNRRPAPLPQPKRRPLIANSSIPSAPPPSTERPSGYRTESASPEESMRRQRAAVQQRISMLDKDESDAVCLRLELISREQVFDRDLQPRRLLLRRAAEVTRAELEDIERAINELRR